MRIRLSFFAAPMFLLAASVHVENETMITTPLIDPKALSLSCDKIAAGESRFVIAFRDAIARADKWLATSPPSVMDKRRTPPSGDKHDYMSLATYWYANPFTSDGMPWIRRDGERNPLTMSSEFDRAAMSQSTNAIIDLILAYRLSGDEKYARHAARMIRAWFLDPATRMNPHLEYGQAIPGQNTGRCIGVIDTSYWVIMLDMIETLCGSCTWPDADHHALQKWFGQYVDWLTTSRLGKDEESQKNNHGTWYDAQVARFALFAGRTDLARTVINKSRTNRIAEQIEPDGRMPLELARTKSFTYSAFNVRAMFYLARMGERLCIDLWHYRTTDGRTLKKSLDYLAPYADPSRSWPHQQIGDEPYRATLSVILRLGFGAYQDERYANLVGQFPMRERDADISMFVYNIK